MTVTPEGRTIDALFGLSVQRSLRVVCVGAHPDDAETGCGGTLAKLADAGHSVKILYLTRGESGFKHLPPEAECWNAPDRGTALAAIRAAEAEKASRLLGANPVFWDQRDGNTSACAEECRRFSALVMAYQPDLLLTHWPNDAHQDHRSAAVLASEAWRTAGCTFLLAYYEVMTGIQTQQFEPNWYVDISATWQRKRFACHAHQSQKPDRFCDYHDKLEQRRGQEASLPRAEAFSIPRRHSRSTHGSAR